MLTHATTYSLTVTAHLIKLEYLKNNYQILIIKLLILVLFIWTVYIGLNDLYSRWYYEIVTSDTKTLIQNSEFMYSIKRFFRPTYLVLIPTIGVFINRQIGWFLITSFFYFVISSSTFILIESNSMDTMDIIIGLLISAFFVFIILIMNKEKIRNGIYNIQNKDLLSKNIIASVIGMGITIIVAYMKQ